MSPRCSHKTYTGNLSNPLSFLLFGLLCYTLRNVILLCLLLRIVPKCLITFAFSFPFMKQSKMMEKLMIKPKCQNETEGLKYLRVCVCVCACIAFNCPVSLSLSPLIYKWLTCACIPSSLCSIAVGVGFYGNSETNDGVYQLTYSLYNANHTLDGVDSLVGETSAPCDERVVHI